MSSQRFILSYLPSIVNLVIGIVFVVMASRRSGRPEVAAQPAKLRTLGRVRVIGFVLIGLALIMMAGEALFGG